jgi:predicted O-methyltransferase YrrM
VLRDKPLHNFLFETDESGFYDNLDVQCTPWIDLCCLLHLIRKRKPATFLEVGTHRGYTARLIAQRFPTLLITTVDPGDKIPPAERPGNQAGEYLSQAELGHIAAPFPSVTIIKEEFQKIDWGEKRFDFFFIDGNHTYPHALADSRLALELLTEHGTIAWHDVHNGCGVDKALGELELSEDIVWLHNTWFAYLLR